MSPDATIQPFAASSSIDSKTILTVMPINNTLQLLMFPLMIRRFRPLRRHCPLDNFSALLVALQIIQLKILSIPSTRLV